MIKRISIKRNNMRFTNQKLIIVFGMLWIIINSVLIQFWDSDGSNLEKWSLTISTTGVFISTCIAIWFVNKDRIKTKEENHSYKISLLINLQSLCHDVNWTTFSFRAQDEVPRDNFDGVTIKEEMYRDFQYWGSLIQARNTNTYVPVHIRDAVSMLLHQGSKPISEATIPPSEHMLETTFVNPLSRIIDSDYFRLDSDKTVQQLLKDVKDDRDKIQLLLKDNSMEKSLGRRDF